MVETNKIFLFLAVVVVLGVVGVYFSYNFVNLGSEKTNTVTGYVVSQGGATAKVPTQKVANPTAGVLKGRVEYIITDNGIAIDTVPAENTQIYFTNSGNIIADYNKVKVSNKNAKYKGSISRVDADDAEIICNSGDYLTTLNYYDTNANSAEDQGEFAVYTLPTDANGCYGTKLPGGSYDIFM